MTDWTEQLSEYLDGGMTADEQVRLEAALEGDVELARVLEDLRAVRETAGSLPRQSPKADLWPRIEARIRASDRGVAPLAGAGQAKRRFSFTVSQLAAAAVALLVLGSASVWVAMNAGTESERAVAVIPMPQADLASDDGRAFSYEATVEGLEEQLRIGRDRLDPETVATLEGSLATIDRAIARAQEALDADPASAYLNRHLADARTRKLRVLQQAARLASS